MASYIELTQGKRAIVDDQFVDQLNRHSWCVNKSSTTCYAKRGTRKGGKQAVIPMHREILTLAGLGAFEEVDHINGNGLDNRLANLRPVTHAENQRNQRKPKHNTSGYKGVSYAARERKWHAQIMVNYKTTCLGYFDNPQLAHAAYVEAAKRLHGELARIE